MKANVIKYISRHPGKIFRYGISFFLPERFLRAFYTYMENVFNKPVFSLSFDIDHEEDVHAVPALLKILKDRGIPASFACVGMWIEKYPEEHRLIVENGFEVINHTYSHPDNKALSPDRYFNLLNKEEKGEEIIKCDEICREILSIKPVGFRTPHFGKAFTNDIYKILIDIGYLYSSSTVSTLTPYFGAPFTVDQEGNDHGISETDGFDKLIVEFPVSTCPKHPFAVFDTWHSLRKPGAWHKKEGEFFGLFKKLIKICIERNAYINLYLDPRDVKNQGSAMDMLDYLGAQEAGLEITNYSDLLNRMEIIRSEEAK